MSLAEGKIGWRHWALVIMAILALLLVCCCGGGVVTEEPTEVVEQETEVVEAPTDHGEVQIDFEVKRNHQDVWATWEEAGLLALLGDADWHELLRDDEGGLVTTDTDGEAELCRIGQISEEDSECEDGTCRIWIYRYGGTALDHYCCPKDMQDDEDVVCTCDGATLATDCEITITTLTADSTAESTSFAVVYVWDLQLTMLFVEEGEVKVTPVDSLDPASELPSLVGMSPQQKAEVWAGMEVSRTPAPESVTVEPWELLPGYTVPGFYYTAPLDMLDLIEEALPGLPNPREPLPIIELPQVVYSLSRMAEELKVPVPDWQPWLEDIGQHAHQMGLQFPEFGPATLQEDTFAVWGPEELLANEYVQDSARAVTDRVGLQYVPSIADDSLTPGWVPEQPVVLLFNAEDSDLADAAEVMAAMLEEQGFKVDVLPVYPGEEAPVLEPGQQVLLLSRR